MEVFVNRLREEAEKKDVHISIFTPNFEGDDPKLGPLQEKERLKNDQYRREVSGKVYDHLFRKVMVADVCFVFNKDGYVGANTNGELFAAAVLGKPIYALDKRILMGTYPNDLYEEPSTHKLIHEITSTPEALLRRLY